MFKKFISTILIMALLLQCSALTVFAAPGIDESFVVEDHIVDETINVAEDSDMSDEEGFIVEEPDDVTTNEDAAEDDIAGETSEAEELEQAEEDEDVAEVEESEQAEEDEQDVPLDENTTEGGNDIADETPEAEETDVVEDENAAEVVEPEQAEEDEQDVPLDENTTESDNDIVDETPEAEETDTEEDENAAEVVESEQSKETDAEKNTDATEIVEPEKTEPVADNTQEKFEAALDDVDNKPNESLTEGRKEYFSLYDNEIPALENMVRDNYSGVDVVNYTSLFGNYQGEIVFEESSHSTVKAYVDTYGSNLDFDKAEAIVGIYTFENAPTLKLEVVYSSESNAPLYFENAIGQIVELGEPKLNARDGKLHSVVYLDAVALEKLNFYANADNAAKVLKLGGSNAVIYAVSISAEKYCFANAVAMISETGIDTLNSSCEIHFPQGVGYGFGVSFNSNELTFNCINHEDSWIQVLSENDEIEICGEKAFAFSLPEVPTVASNTDLALPSDKNKKDENKPDDENDNEKKLASDTDIHYAETEKTDGAASDAQVPEVEAVPDATPIEPEVTEEIFGEVEKVTEVIEENNSNEDSLELVDTIEDKADEDVTESVETTNDEAIEDVAEVAEDSVEDAAENIAEDADEDPVENTVEDVTEETTEDAVEEAAEESEDEAVEESTEESEEVQEEAAESLTAVQELVNFYVENASDDAVTVLESLIDANEVSVI